jgi:hypothetical protein
MKTVWPDIWQPNLGNLSGRACGCLLGAASAVQSAMAARMVTAERTRTLSTGVGAV